MPMMPPLLLLFLLPLLLLPPPALAVPPTLQSVSPATFATEGGDTALIVSATPLTPRGPAVCRLNSPPTGGTTFRHGGYLCGKAVEGNVNCVGDHIDFPATILNATHASCSPPAVFVGGAGALSLSLDNGSAWTFSAPLPVRYETLVDVAIGRRPYTNETEGALLLALSPRLHGASVAVVAALPCASSSGGGGGAKWSWSFAVENSSVALRFPLSALPASINNDLSISFEITPAAATSASANAAAAAAAATAAAAPWAPPGGAATMKFVKWRRLMRTTTAPAAGVESVQVEHHTRALRVNGSSFVGQGWYYSVSRHVK